MRRKNVAHNIKKEYIKIKAKHKKEINYVGAKKKHAKKNHSTNHPTTHIYTINMENSTVSETSAQQISYII